MNVQDVVTRVRRKFGDEAAVQVSDADVIRWINDAQVEILKRNESALQKTALVNLVANQSTYTMPSDLLMLRSLRYKLSDMLSFSALKYKSLQEFDEAIDGWDGTAYTAGYPRFFTIFENIVTLFPTPDRAATGGLKVLYNQKPTDVTVLADALSLPLIYHNTIVSYCMWQASHLDEDHEPALMYRNDFSEDMALIQGKETRDPTATYPVISVLEYDM